MPKSDITFTRVPRRGRVHVKTGTVLVSGPRGWEIWVVQLNGLTHVQTEHYYAVAYRLAKSWARDTLRSIENAHAEALAADALLNGV